MGTGPDGLMTREDVQTLLANVAGPVASFIALVAVFLLGLALLRDLRS